MANTNHNNNLSILSDAFTKVLKANNVKHLRETKSNNFLLDNVMSPIVGKLNSIKALSVRQEIATAKTKKPISRFKSHREIVQAVQAGKLDTNLYFPESSMRFFVANLNRVLGTNVETLTPDEAFEIFNVMYSKATITEYVPATKAGKSADKKPSVTKASVNAMARTQMREVIKLKKMNVNGNLPTEQMRQAILQAW